MTSPDTPSVVAVVLAAGASRRLGRSKALLAFGPDTALSVLVETLRIAGVASIVVVAGIDEAVAVEGSRCGCAVVRNPRPDAGRTGSVQIGLASLPQSAAMLLAPVDAPLVAPATVRAVLDRGTDSPIVRPRCRLGAGHPTLFAAALRREIEELPVEASLRDLVRRDAGRVLDVATDDLEVTANLDTPEAYTEALARWAARGGR